MSLILDDYVFSYGNKPVLKHVSSVIERGKVTAIAGPNGVGKSTLLKCIARLIVPDSGKSSLDGTDLSSLNIKALSKIQAYVPQNTELSFPLTVREFVSLGRRPYVEWNFSDEDNRVIEENCEYMGIGQYSDKLLDELSGGERQKVILTRALIQEPQVMLLDEPTSALDVKHQLEVMRILRRIAAERNCAVVIVMHDLSLIRRFADDTILMSAGEILAQGPTETILTEENIRQAYGVRAMILETEHGSVILPYEE